MIKKTFAISIFSLLIFIKLSFSQPYALVFYSAPFYPEYQAEAMNTEPMQATATNPVAAPQSEMAVSALPGNDNDMYLPTVIYNSQPKTYTSSPMVITHDPVLRDFRDNDKVYIPIPKNSSASEIKKNHPIRDFRTEYWRDKYYRDDFHNNGLYKDTYKGYNYYK